MVKLLISLPDAGGDVAHDLTADTVTLGRESDNIVQISEGSISAHHAQFIRTESGYLLKDLHSTNRTWIRGISVSEVELNSTCVIRFGEVDCVYFPEADGPVWTDATVARRELKNVAEERDALGAEKRKLSEELGEQKQRADSLQAKATATQDRLDGITALHAKTTQRIKELLAERDTAREHAEDLSRDIGNLRANIVSLTSERDTARAQHAEASGKFREQEAQLHAAQHRVGILESTFEKTSCELSEAQHALEALRVERSAEKKCRETLEAEVTNVRATLKEAEAAREKERNEAAGKIADLERRAAAAEMERSQLNATREQLAADLASARAESEQLRDRWRELASELRPAHEAELQVSRFLGELERRMMAPEKAAEEASAEMPEKKADERSAPAHQPLKKPEMPQTNASGEVIKDQPARSSPDLEQAGKPAVNGSRGARSRTAIKKRERRRQK